MIRLAWLYLLAQFLPWVFQDGTGAHGFLVPEGFGVGWYSAWTELAVALAFAVIALLRVGDVAPRARLALPEVTLALAAVTVARILVAVVGYPSPYATVPAVGAFVGVAVAVGLVVLAFADRRATA
jgi:hypothetical protein